MRNSRLYALLAYAGALPFVVCALLLVTGTNSLPLLGSVSNIATTYSLAIVAFMSGIHWAVWQHRSDTVLPPLLIWSNGLTLVMWFAYLLGPTEITLGVAVVCFALLLAIDARLSHLKVISADYFAVRRTVSVVVLASLLVMLAIMVG